MPARGAHGGINMIIQVDTPEYADIFAAVYNSANTLFENSEQYDATGKIFLPQLKDDENFIYSDGDEIVGFMSFHCYEHYSELTSLYIKKEVQNQGIGDRLIRFFEQKIRPDTLILVKVLTNAPWALRFYQKHNYAFFDDETAESLRALGLAEKPWEKILYKKL